MSCQGPWSNKDEFRTYTDCHVWSPWYLIVDVLIIVFGVINAARCAHRYRYLKQKQRPLIIVSGVGLVLLVCTFIARRATGIVIGSKNVAINFFLALTCGHFWGVLGLIVKQYMEVMLLSDKGSTRAILERFRTALNVFIVLISAATAISLIGPCLTDDMDFKGWWATGLGGQIAFTVLLLYYGVQVRKLLRSMERSKVFYADIIKRLDMFLVPWAIGVVPLVLMSLCCLFLPAFTRNNYITVNCVFLQFPGFINMVLKTSAPGLTKKPDKGEPDTDHSQDLTQMSNGDTKLPNVGRPSTQTQLPVIHPGLTLALSTPTSETQQYFPSPSSTTTTSSSSSSASVMVASASTPTSAGSGSTSSDALTPRTGVGGGTNSNSYLSLTSQPLQRDISTEMLLIDIGGADRDERGGGAGIPSPSTNIAINLSDRKSVV